jgi:hypothetical protein
MGARPARWESDSHAHLPPSFPPDDHPAPAPLSDTVALQWRTTLSSTGTALALFEDSSDVPHVEEPERFLEVVEAFLERVEG